MIGAKKRFALTAAILGLIGGIAGRADADLTIYTDPSYNVIGNSSYPTGAFGTSSWQANTTSSSTLDNKSELYISAATLFANSTHTGPVTVGDIQSISYWTNKPGNSGSPDWTFLIYTAKTNDGTDTGSFYHTRLESEPYFTNTPPASDPSNTWHQWSTSGPNPMRFYDTARDGGAFGTYTDPTLAGIQSGGGTWQTNGATVANYSSEVINLFSLQTGSAWANGFTGLVDGLTITLKDGTTENVNLEAIATPEPSTLVMAAAAGLSGLVYSWRRRKQTA